MINATSEIHRAAAHGATARAPWAPASSGWAWVCGAPKGKAREPKERAHQPGVTSLSFKPLTALLLAVCTGLALWGCDKPPPQSAPDAPAGQVQAVEGLVTATRAVAGAQARALAVAGPVFADDTVVTPPEASVSIRLLHNQALWRLDGGQSKRVDQTAAWRASQESAPQALAPQAQEVATASAGRHSEREAAASAESAVRTAESSPAPARAEPAPAPAQAAPRPRVDLARKQAARAEPVSRPAKGASGAAVSSRRAALGGQADDLDLGLGQQGGSGQGSGGYKKEEAMAPSPPGTAGSGSAAKDYAGHRLEIASILITCADDELKATLLTALHRLKSGLLQCQRTALRVNPVLVEQLQAELTVDPQGKLNELSVTPSTQPLAACVQSRLKSMGGLPPRPAPTKVQIVLKFIAK